MSLSAHGRADCRGRHPADDDDQGRRARAAALGVPFNGVAATPRRSRRSAWLLPPAPAPAPVASDTLSAGVAASILNKTVLPDSLTDTQHTQVRFSIARALAVNLDVPVALLADDTPRHAQLRWAVLRGTAQLQLEGDDIDEATVAAATAAATACAAAARDGDAMHVVRARAREDRRPHRELHRFYLRGIGEQWRRGGRVGGHRGCGGRVQRGFVKDFAGRLRGTARARRWRSRRSAQSRLRVVPALAARAPLPAEESQKKVGRGRGRVHAPRDGGRGAPERGVAPADACSAGRRRSTIFWRAAETRRRPL